MSHLNCGCFTPSSAGVEWVKGKSERGVCYLGMIPLSAMKPQPVPSRVDIADFSRVGCQRD
jgi:hypothetical protein